MSGTLAYNMRPQSLLDILGQKHIIGENGLFTKFVEKNHPMSVILYGPPGCGKTTLAMALSHDLNMPCRTFNASTGNKKEMDLIIEEAKLSNGLFVIIDEIHRMNKMKQDNLLPYVESGLLIIVGCTTANPYHSINPAIRSRCQIIEVKPLTQEDIIQGLHHALDSEKGYHHQYQCDEEVLQHIARLSSGDIRFAYNCLEVCTIISHDNHITIEDAKNALTQANGQFDKDEDQYYDTLSGLQKSIRGSDVDASLHYLAKLLAANDLESLSRRLLAIAYEDIALANPTIGPRVKAAVDAARELGNPEARLPLSVIVIEMALSQKSNSAYLAIDEAIKDIEDGKSGSLPLNLKNTYSFNPNQQPYLYPHNYPNAWVYQQYMPDTLKDRKYYHPKASSKMELGLKERYDLIESYKQDAIRQSKK